jgi:hypothetical protein
MRTMLASFQDATRLGRRDAGTTPDPVPQEATTEPGRVDADSEATETEATGTEATDEGPTR